MDLAVALTGIGLPDAVELLAPHWDESEAARPRGVLPFLEPAKLRWAREFTSLPETLDEPFGALAAHVTADEALAAVMWHQSRLLFEYDDYEPGAVARWPLPQVLSAAEEGLYTLALAFNMLPHMLARHRERGIPESQSRYNCSSWPATSNMYGYTHDGRPGYPPRSLYWQRHHAVGILHRVGRFEFMLRPFAKRVRVYRRADGTTVALAEGGQEFTAAGNLDPGVEAPDGFVSPPLDEVDGVVTGTVMNPNGHGVRGTVALDLREWSLVLQGGETVLEMHIPSGGNMHLETCLASLHEATAYFRRYFPEQPFHAIVCASWIFDPHIEQWWRPDNNMSAFQHELYLYPWPSGGRDGLYFIFGDQEVDLATAPRDNSLRRAMIDHLTGGGRCRVAGMFVLTADLADLGGQLYRRRFAELNLV